MLGREGRKELFIALSFGGFKDPLFILFNHVFV